MSKLLRLFMVVVVLIVVLAGAALTAAYALFDPNKLKPTITEAVEKATGRTLTISGKIGLKFSLIPTVTVDGVSLSNPVGFSRPDMLRVGRVELSLALLPLLHRQVEIAHIGVEKVDLLLETDAAGRGNWVQANGAPMTGTAGSGSGAPMGGTATQPATPAAPAGPATGQRPNISIQDITIDDARIATHIGATPAHVVDIQHLTLSAADNAPIQAAGTISIDSLIVKLTARTGALAALDTANEAAPWPVAVSLTSDGLTLTASGTIAHPLEKRGITLAVDGAIPDFKVLSAFVPGTALDKIHGLTIHAEASDASVGPSAGVLDLKIKSIDIGADGHLTDIAINGKGAAPIQIAAKFSRPGFEGAVGGTAGTLPWLMHAGVGPLAIDLTATGPSSKASVKGTIQDPRHQAGIAMDIAADIADLTQIVPAAPPGAKALTARVHFAGLTEPVTFQINSASGDLSGSLTGGTSPRPNVSGSLKSDRFDFDAFLGRTATAAPKSGEPLGKKIEEKAEAKAKEKLEEKVGLAKPEPKPTGNTDAVLPVTPLPFADLKKADAAIKFSFAKLRARDTDFAGLTGTVSLNGGVLRLDPFSVASPPMNVSLSVDAAQATPAVRAVVKSSGVPLALVLKLAGQPPIATGAAEVRMDVNGAGESAHAIAASLNGWTGVAVQNGVLDMQEIHQMMDRLGPFQLGGNGNTDLRCLAIRTDIKAGVAAISAGALGSAPLTAEAGGQINLGRETMDLQIRPRTRLGGIEVVVPVKVDGPWRQPAGKADFSPAAVGGAGLANILMGEKKAGTLPDPCPRALALARDTTPPPEAAPSAEPSPSALTPAAKAAPAVNILKNLLAPRR